MNNSEMLRERYEALKRQSDESRLKLAEAKDAIWDRVGAGVPAALYQSLRQSQEVAWEHVSDPNPKVRYAALFCVSRPEQRDSSAVEAVAKRFLQTDPDRLIRELAISLLGSLHRGSGNPEIAKTLAQTVADETQGPSTRGIAYLSLLDVVFGPQTKEADRTPIRDRDDARQRLAALRQQPLPGSDVLSDYLSSIDSFPKGVDWNFVSQCLKRA